ncbi:hypothetical protein F383_07530 [Gossypium arboreum]|uniref:Uncharacterized protein n=1 Tax=Gossypium arboreum TaxID=29729 RepID=A0A0B0PMZ4_GOSAR|nr:hypothetical protein F383_07530 [Gossypium arboreum]
MSGTLTSTIASIFDYM